MEKNCALDQIKRLLDSNACFTLNRYRTAPSPMSDAQHTADARERLLLAATQIFADKGYALASTREICKLAEVNVAAIHYYFGDKASLYREIFRIPEQVMQLPAELDDPQLSTVEAMQAWYGHLMSFAAYPDQATRMRLLILREQMQPSGVLEQGKAEILNPWHQQLVRFLAPRLGTDVADVDLHNLAFSLVGIAMVLFVERAAVMALAPGLLDNAVQLQKTVQRLARHGSVLVEAEALRRRELRAAQSNGNRATGVAHRDTGLAMEVPP
jgi:AcrR family transcriptional regulator